MVKIPKGFKGSIDSDASEFKAVVISGSLEYNEATTLKPGSFITSQGKSRLAIENDTNEDAIVYIRASSPYDVNE